MDNPWNIESIYELQFFTCQTCIFKNHSKQEIINHAYETHPESIECLKNIKDESLKDLLLPWNENIPFESQNISKMEQETKEEPKIKEELDEDMDDQNPKYHVYTLDADGKLCEYGVTEDSENITHNSQNMEISPEATISQLIEKNSPHKKPFQEIFEVNTAQDCQDKENYELVKDVIIEEINGEGEQNENYEPQDTIVQNVHASITKCDTCDICGLTVKDPEALKKHVQVIHEFEKDHKCYYCEKSFKKYEYLKTHIKSFHSEYERNKCDSCGKSFRYARDLKRHVKTVHEGVKDHKCDSCGKSFSQAWILKSHVKAVHEGVKDHKCDSCGKSFTQAVSLRTHVKAVHKGVKDHKCDSCGKSFSQAAHLRGHVKTVHKGVKDH